MCNRFLSRPKEGVFIGNRRARLARGLIAVVLGAGAILAIGNYTDFGRWPQGSCLNGWEFFHYYLQSKYAAEARYTGLYEAALTGGPAGPLYESPFRP